MTAVSSIRNLGPKVEQMFKNAGIHTAEEVRRLGPDEAYRRLLRSGVRPHFIGYYCIYLGLQDRPWNDMSADEKAARRVKFDALVAEEKSRKGALPQLESELDKLGVIRR